MSEPTEEQIQEITHLILEGRKIEAIKIYREATNEGLKEAKDFVDDLTARLRQTHPDKFKVPESSKAGCSSVIDLPANELRIAFQSSMELVEFLAHKFVN